MNTALAKLSKSYRCRRGAQPRTCILIGGIKNISQMLNWGVGAGDGEKGEKGCVHKKSTGLRIMILDFRAYF